REFGELMRRGPELPRRIAAQRSEDLKPDARVVVHQPFDPCRREAACGDVGVTVRAGRAWQPIEQAQLPQDRSLSEEAEHAVGIHLGALDLEPDFPLVYDVAAVARTSLLEEPRAGCEPDLLQVLLQDVLLVGGQLVQRLRQLHRTSSGGGGEGSIMEGNGPGRGYLGPPARRDPNGRLPALSGQPIRRSRL